ncbi:glycosyltransferase family 2 protein [Cellulophaga sp. E16_2]|uniref:Glycosyl transferase family 2 n=1 Tax=Cellulophaga algicola (strain DSM 14237 / IC166 / ACAM 630) TaxID=688270 RepID=E6XCU1_CELAD|nr:MULTISPECIES: glycosyltransferase family 2 protein [Cellulophaga]ADV50082.1 glycosyl transferase family 2 [Cellulophaga algicola DSM 14237]MBO0592456.1 glycosyltransferase family 2 protein [Cellulophaga sp. E16_2]
MEDKLSIIISTYNSEEWLQKVIWGYNLQSYKNFEVVIADDGSKEATKHLIDELRKEVFYEIRHVWHKDDGFKKCKILNKALTVCSSEYILMTDGDCIPRKDFVQVHYENRQKGYFLSGGYSKLPLDISQQITKQDIENQNCFNLKWLKEQGLPKKFKKKKLGNDAEKAKLFNKITTTKASWNGHNASGWKKDILSVNGFDERMEYGGEDREMGHRLFHRGIKGKQIRYSAVCIHLDHERGYVTKEAIHKNKKIRKETKFSKSIWSPYGIMK